MYIFFKHENGYSYTTVSPIDLKTGMRCLGPRCLDCLWGRLRITKNTAAVSQWCSSTIRTRLTEADWTETRRAGLAHGSSSWAFSVFCWGQWGHWWTLGFADCLWKPCLSCHGHRSRPWTLCQSCYGYESLPYYSHRGHLSPVTGLEVTFNLCMLYVTDPPWWFAVPLIPPCVFRSLCGGLQSRHLRWSDLLLYLSSQTTFYLRGLALVRKNYVDVEDLKNEVTIPFLFVLYELLCWCVFSVLIVSVIPFLCLV